MSYGKLVRDGIPAKIETNGETPITRVLEQDEFEVELVKKLEEEVREFIKNKSPQELADISEVVRALSLAIGYSPEHIEDMRLQKEQKLGGFAARLYLENVEE